MDRECIAEFFLRFRGAIVALVVLVLCVSGGVFFMETRNERRAEEGSDAVYMALKNDNDESAINELNDIASRNKGMPSYLAKFRLAALYAKDGRDISSAKKLYNDLAIDKGLAQELRELAEYLGVMISLGEGELDAELEDKLMRLTSGSGRGVYKSSAKEALVALKLRKGETDAAVRIMKEIVGDATTASEVMRNAESLLRVYDTR